MQTITTIGLDIAKSVFQLHGIDTAGTVVIRRQLKRHYVLGFFENRFGAEYGLQPSVLHVRTTHSGQSIT